MRIGRAVCSAPLELVLRFRLKLVLVQTRSGRMHRAHDPQIRYARCFPDHRDLALALDGAQRVDEGIEILNLRFGRGLHEFEPERLLAAGPAVPRIIMIQLREQLSVVGGCTPEHLGTKRRQQRPALLRNLRQHSVQIRARAHGRNANRSSTVLAGIESSGPVFGTDVEFLDRQKEDHGLAGASIQERDRARLRHAGEIVELIALPKRLFSRTLRRSLQDGDAVPRSCRRDARAEPQTHPPGRCCETRVGPCSTCAVRAQQQA